MTSFLKQFLISALFSGWILMSLGTVQTAFADDDPGVTLNPICLGRVWNFPVLGVWNCPGLKPFQTCPAGPPVQSCVLKSTVGGGTSWCECGV